MSLSFMLRTDGSSDRALIPILEWLLREHSGREFTAYWFDIRQMSNPPKHLAAQLQLCLQHRACDLLFVHRDAEKEPYVVRHQEIVQALAGLRGVPPYICVIPVRMQEAWLLFDERAIKEAVGNAHNRVPLPLPVRKQLEHLPDPKEVLYDLIKRASGRTGRRLSQINIPYVAQQIPQHIQDFSPLRSLPAFQALEEEVAQAVQANGWAAN